MKYKIFTWDWKETAPVSDMLEYAKQVGFSFDAEIGTESDFYAHIISDTPLDEQDIQALFEDDD